MFSYQTDFYVGKYNDVGLNTSEVLKEVFVTIHENTLIFKVGPLKGFCFP